jgi:DNA-binding NtrC family response regulator
MQRQFLTRIFIIEDDLVFGKVIQRALEQENDAYEVTVFQTGQAFLDQIHLVPDVVSIDYTLPDYNGLEILQRIKQYQSDIATIILSGQDKLEVVVDAYNKGADNYIIKNDNALIQLKQVIKGLSNHASLRKEVEELRSQIIDRNKYSSVVGESQGVLKVLRMIQKVEGNNILVMITGESGTGKEVIANAIHFNSPRKRKPFVPVNMAAIPADLIESELFGHEKGAFTGATGRRIGKFEEANGGTIFLDEIGEMDINLQTKLLRVLQEHKVSRVGSNKEIQLDVRVIAATNKNLGERVKQGLFREDLYYRLQGFLIHLPPLRDRNNDVVILARFFLKEFCRANRIAEKTLTKSALESMLRYEWPGNVRELKTLVERAALISDTNEIVADDLLYADTVWT